MIDRILNYFGYEKRKVWTEEEIISYYCKLIGNPVEYSLSKEEDELFFKNLDMVDGAREYFKATMAKDVMRYFGAKGQTEQDTVRGGFARTAYFMSKLKEQSAPTKLSNKRYK